MRKLMLGARAGIVFLALWATSNVALALTLSPFTGFLFNNPIGIDFHEPTGKLLMSVNWPTGIPHNFDLVDAGGTPTQFSALGGLTEEVKIATVRAGACQGGFTAGQAFTGNGNPGALVKISPDGLTVSNPWVTLPGELAKIRGSLFQDRFCAAGGDLIVVTGNEENSTIPGNDTLGNVWRVTSAGVATKVATLNKHLEGVTTVPNDPSIYGPLAGRIIAGDEDFVNAPACTGAADPSTCNGANGKIFAVNPNALDDYFTIGAGTGVAGHTHYQTAAHFNPEDLDIIRGNAKFFGVAFRDGKVLTAAASDFAGLCGQVLVTQEFPLPNTSGLSALTWDGTKFVATLLTSNVNVQQWEHTTFTSGQDCFGIKVEKSPKNGTFAQGGQASFTIVVTATGVNADTNVVLTDQLPGNGGLVWTSATASNAASCGIVANLLTCHLGTIQPGATNAVTVVVKSTLNTPIAACTTQPNPHAHVTADRGLVADDSGSLTCTPPPPPPHLKVVKTPDGGTFAKGGPVSFKIVVTNDGGSTATGVKLNDQLPTAGGLSWATATITTGQGSCSISAGSLLTCSIGSINAGNSVTVTVSLPRTPVSACQSQVNLAAIATDDRGDTARDRGDLTCKNHEDTDDKCGCKNHEGSDDKCGNTARDQGDQSCKNHEGDDDKCGCKNHEGSDDKCGDTTRDRGDQSCKNHEG